MPITMKISLRKGLKMLLNDDSDGTEEEETDNEDDRESVINFISDEEFDEDYVGIKSNRTQQRVYMCIV